MQWDSRACESRIWSRLSASLCAIWCRPTCPRGRHTALLHSRQVQSQAAINHSGGSAWLPAQHAAARGYQHRHKPHSNRPASPQTEQQHPLLAKLWHLMRELSTQCPVLAAGEYTTSSEADSLCSDPQIQLHLCQPVQGINSITQSFFAAACSPPYSLQISNVKSLLARPAAAAVQYTQNAHTAACLITCSTATAAGKSAVSSSTQSGVSKDEEAKRSSQHPCGHNAATEKLQALVDAASMVRTNAAPSLYIDKQHSHQMAQSIE